MANCKGCVMYSEEYDKLRQRYDDVLIVGEDPDEVHHFCEAFSPIENGVFNTDKECPQYQRFQGE